ncbi:transposase [Lentisalinibacter sediminis]|uniref:transposase n=1 Tax=Lentisalinibacter sediminis TaxID=2992237 RepID=UPI003868A054
MTRPRRLHVPGSLYHVILRGNNRQEIFFSVADRVYLDQLVGRATASLKAEVHAYCWMPNHIHMAIRVGEAPLGRLMQWIASRYAFRVNRQREATGHLFERRYRALLVDVDAYALQLVRYIHLNPVKAGLIRNPADYPWSSHRYYLGGDAPPWLRTDWILAMFGNRRIAARAAYRRFVGDDPDAELPPEFLAGDPEDERVTGADRLLSEPNDPLDARPADQDLDGLIAAAAQRHGCEVAAITGPSRERRLVRVRREIARQARDRGVASVAEIARRLNRSDSAVARLLRS